jgi:hypothetical protein
MDEPGLDDFSALTCPVLSPRVENGFGGGRIERLPLIVSDLLAWVIRHIDSFHLEA